MDLRVVSLAKPKLHTGGQQGDDIGTIQTGRCSIYQLYPEEPCRYFNLLGVLTSQYPHSPNLNIFPN